MGRFYGIRVKEGTMEIGDVPQLWRKAAEKWLEADR